ncbi:energy transducer TonB [Fulvivirga ligni]|uniref:energy transducer TonB n=1 Tax=Fulvivirga ligni TaxID=2904246 RepID=UPI001F1F085C|nr:energy transducer TonB [Fulvivirga ligni]UII22713.1 energy transducer TonB [Fulvivirga ligni]
MKKFVFITSILMLSMTSCKSQNHSQDARLIGSVDSLFQAIQDETTLKFKCEEKRKVHLDYIIKEDGNVGKVTVAKGICPKADSIATVIVKRLKYHPAIRDNNAVEVRKSIAIPFRWNE